MLFFQIVLSLLFTKFERMTLIELPLLFFYSLLS